MAASGGTDAIASALGIISGDEHMRIWVDADACPKTIKEFIFRLSGRRGIPVVLVANRAMHVPKLKWVTMEVVGGAPDAADHHILEHCTPADLVVTADIPLAAALIDKGVVAINPRGTVYTPDNVKDALATRNLMHDLREEGTMSGGPPALGPRDREQFANAVDRELTRLRRRSPSTPD